MNNQETVQLLWHKVNSPEHPTLSSGEVHVWRVLLSEVTEVKHGVKNLLSKEEHNRASRYRFERDWKRFTIGRGVLRTLLGRYLRISPSSIEIIYGEHGKPNLGEASIQFNVSYSRELVLYAFSASHRLGIDLEYKNPDVDLADVARSHFSQQEIDALLQLPKRERLAGFYNCWTRKEAYIKAIGEGLTYPLDEFAVSLIPGDPPELLHIDRHPNEINRWSLFSFTPGEGYQAAMAVEGHGYEISQWHFAA